MFDKFKTTLFTFASLALLSGCSSDSETEDEITRTPFSLNFSAMNGEQHIDCDTTATGFGAEGHYSVGVSDLRFYVSNIELFDQYGEKIDVEFDSNEFQLNHNLGFVGLIDLTSNSSGTCTSDAIPNSEGTARVNNVLTGSMIDIGVNKITFDIGVPQAIMKQVIATTSAEDAPSPLNEMYWSWASGYRHFVMNFAIESMMGNTGEGYIHVGSRGCGGDSLLALENKEQCDFVNTPKVELSNFEPSMDSIVLRIDHLLAQLSFAPAMGGHGEHSGDSEMMDNPSVTCHSASPDMQPDCTAIFENFGLSTADGSSSIANNRVVQH